MAVDPSINLLGGNGTGKQWWSVRCLWNVRDINQVAVPAEIKTQWTVVNFGIRPESRRKDQEDGGGLKHELFLR